MIKETNVNCFSMWNFVDAKKFALVTALATGAIFLSAIIAAGPAEAKVKLSQCQLKHIACSERCIMKSKGENAAEQGNACIKRTCDKQNAGCGPSSLPDTSGGGKLIDTKPKGNSKASGVLVPRGTGVLSNQTQPSNQRPAKFRPRAPLMGSGVVIR